jgi:hypothetical protein
MKLEVELLAKTSSIQSIEAKKLEETLRRNFVNHIFTKGIHTRPTQIENGISSFIPL